MDTPQVNLVEWQELGEEEEKTRTALFDISRYASANTDRYIIIHTWTKFDLNPWIQIQNTKSVGLPDHASDQVETENIFPMTTRS